MVGGKVLDKKMLRTIFAAVFGFLGTAGPLFFALRPVSAAVGVGACALPAYHLNAIRAVMASANATCIYNVSLSDVLV